MPNDEDWYEVVQGSGLMQGDLGWSVVDFHRAFVVSKPVVVAVALSAGLRLRQRSPYREYLAQAFARYFMRVGLPLDAEAFETEGEV